ncbi:MAG: hypothetical protein LBT53_03355, partial [Puniceicoccales bacterium]|nr:hypothetical protein [Puniceicoccales bacterium]
MPSLQEEAYTILAGGNPPPGMSLEKAAYLNIIAGGGGGGGGGGGTTDYDALNNRPSVNNVLLTGNVSLSALGAANAADVENLSTVVSALQGLGGYLPAYDFGAAGPSQEDLTNYALSAIGLTDPLQIFNGTRVKNTADGHLWILANTPNSDPPVFEWVDDGGSDILVDDTVVAGSANPVSGGAVETAIRTTGRRIIVPYAAVRFHDNYSTDFVINVSLVPFWDGVYQEGDVLVVCLGRRSWAGNGSRTNINLRLEGGATTSKSIHWRTRAILAESDLTVWRTNTGNTTSS